MSLTAVQADIFLHHLEIQSSNPERLSNFYSNIMDMKIDKLSSDKFLCDGPSRKIIITLGKDKILSHAGMVCRNENKRITLKISLIRNGNTPLNVSEILTSPAILFIINTFNPTGGVINPTSTTIKVNIPNHIAVSSGVIPNSSVIIKGKNTGIVNSIIAKLSIKQPKNKYSTRMQATIKKGERLFSKAISPSWFGS